MKPLDLDCVRSNMHPLPWGTFGYVPDPQDPVLGVADNMRRLAESLCFALNDLEYELRKRRIGPWY